jgi:uncharacterized protein
VIWAKRVLKFGIPAGLILTLALFYYVGNQFTQPLDHKVPALAINEERLDIKATDGVRVAASYFPVLQKDAPGILLLHGNQASREMYGSHIAWLNAAGYAVLAIDFRGHGQSQGETRSFGFHEARDAHAAFAWLKHKQDGARVGVIGASLGGAAALTGEDGPLPADGLIVKAVYPTIRDAIYNRISTRAGGALATILEPMLSYQSYFRFGASPAKVSPMMGARKFAGQVLIIGGGQDHYTPPNETNALSKAFIGSHEIWIVDGLGHDETTGLDNAEYRNRVLAFFDRALG